METIEQLTAENERLLRKSNGLLKKAKKMIRESNRHGAALVISYVEEIKSQRLKNADKIILMLGIKTK